MEAGTQLNLQVPPTSDMGGWIWCSIVHSAANTMMPPLTTLTTRG